MASAAVSNKTNHRPVSRSMVRTLDLLEAAILLPAARARVMVAPESPVCGAKSAGPSRWLSPALPVTTVLCQSRASLLGLCLFLVPCLRRLLHPGRGGRTGHCQIDQRFQFVVRQRAWLLPGALSESELEVLVDVVVASPSAAAPAEGLTPPLQEMPISKQDQK